MDLDDTTFSSFHFWVLLPKGYIPDLEKGSEWS